MFCPSCGEELPEGAKFCKNCGKDLSNLKQPDAVPVPVAENDHKIAIIIGYVLALLSPLLGCIVAVYLYTRDSENAKKHAKFVVLLAFVVWIISMVMVMH